MSVDATLNSGTVFQFRLERGTAKSNITGVVGHEGLEGKGHKMY